jgi:alkylhydroperoxidase family enzyme
MARLPYLNLDDLAPEHRDLLNRNINIRRLLAHSPDGARNYSHIGQYIRFGSKLDPRLREMAILQVGYLTKSAYAYSHHIKIGRDFGVTDKDIHAIHAETEGKDSGLPELDRAVLRAAREMTEAFHISDETFGVLRNEFDSRLLVDLILVISFYNMTVRILASLEIEIEPEYQPYLGQFPLP